jgi:peptidoglycan/LPS O-acetylase OafA/YrhL
MVSRAGPIEGFDRVSTYGVGSALLVHGLLAAELRGTQFPRVAQYLGDASYSIYIWHMPLLIWLSFAFEPTLIKWNSSPYAILVARIVLILSFALISYSYLELPMRKYLRRAGNRMAALAAARSAPARSAPVRD